jgi:hypothetical protein
VKTAACRSCDAPIIWAITKTEARMPLDATPVIGEPGQRGVFMLVKRTEDDPLAWPVELADTNGEFHRLRLAMYVSHFSSCPNAASHRRRAA